MGLLTGCGKGSCLHSLASWWCLWWVSCHIVSDPSDSMDCSLPGSSAHEISQAKILGCHFLLQGDLPNSGIEPHLLCLLHCGRILYHLSHQGSHLEPRTKIWPSLDPKAFHQGTRELWLLFVSTCHWRTASEIPLMTAVAGYQLPQKAWQQV